jgi:hypothetical protein
MKPIIIYEHKCKRCEKTFRSASQTPLCCGKCKSPYWNRPRKKAA